MLRKLWVLVAFLSAVGAPAEARWQNIRWGMTPAEVVAGAGKGAVFMAPSESARKSTMDGSKVAKVSMPYVSGSNQFNAVFLFDASGGLCAVELDQIGGNADALAGDMLAKYGKPREHTQSYVAEVYWWDAGDDQVSFRNIGGHASLWYEPRITANNSGL